MSLQYDLEKKGDRLGELVHILVQSPIFPPNK